MSDWRNTLPMITNKIKHHLYNNRKADHINHITRWIQQYDPQGLGLMTRYDFEEFMRKIGIFLSTQEYRCVYDAYAAESENNPSKLVSYTQILDIIKSDMSEYRLSLVKNAFQFIDEKRAGKLTIQELCQKYRADEHPRARTLMKTIEQVRKEFEDQIQLKSSDGVHITEQEFLSYYSDLNLTHANEKDEYFADLILRTWAVTTGENYVSPERIADLEIILYEKIRQKTFTKTNEGLTANNTFRYFDLSNTGFIDYDQFVKACEIYGCTFDTKELVALFNKYEDNGTGRIIFKDFAQVFANLGSGKYPNINPIFAELQKVPEEVLQRARSFFQGKNISGVQLREAFEKQDVYCVGYLNRENFEAVIQRYGLVLSKIDKDSLYRHFDNNFQDQIDYRGFASYF